MAAQRQEAEKELVKSLTSLVNAAIKMPPTVPASFDGEQHQQSSNLAKDQTSVNSVMKKLYPSTNNSSHSFSPHIADKTRLTAAQVWGIPSKKKKGRNANNLHQTIAPKKIIVKDTLKDVIFINDPKMVEVPRKKQRAYYYQNDMVALAVKFRSDMDDLEIREEICARFPQIFNISVNSFVFVKAVDDTLVAPSNQYWDYKTMKHVTSQGPVYIRSNEYVVPPKQEENYDGESNVSNADSDSSDMESHDINEKVDYISNVSPKKKIKKKYIAEQDNVNNVNNKNKKCKLSCDDAQSCSKVDISKYFSKQPKIACPVCYKSFPADALLQHGMTCAADKYDFLYDSEDNSDNINIVESDTTIPYEEEYDKSVDNGSDSDYIQLNKVLSDLKLLQDKAKKSMFQCRRKCPWSEYCNYIAKPWNKKGESLLCVTFLNEAAVDTGGPRREFFSVALKQMSESLFPEGTPIGSIMLQKEYLYAGKLMAQSLLQGGPVPCLLADWCYKVVCSKKIIDPLSFCPTEEFLKIPLIQKLVDASTDKIYQDLLMEDEIMEKLSKIGYRGLTIKETIHNRDKIIKAIYYKEQIEPKLAALNQLAEGLDVRGLLGFVRQNPHGFKDCFVFNENDISLEIFHKNVEVRYSTEGSNKENIEIDVYKCFCDFLEELFHNDNVIHGIKDLLQFLTGCHNIPALGLERKISVEFEHDCLPSCRCLPMVSTCSLTLTIPVHINSSEQMLQCMTRALIESPIFGRV